MLPSDLEGQKFLVQSRSVEQCKSLLLFVRIRCMLFLSSILRGCCSSSCSHRESALMTPLRLGTRSELLLSACEVLRRTHAGRAAMTHRSGHTGHSSQSSPALQSMLADARHVGEVRRIRSWMQRQFAIDQRCATGAFSHSCTCDDMQLMRSDSTIALPSAHAIASLRVCSCQTRILLPLAEPPLALSLPHEPS